MKFVPSGKLFRHPAFYCLLSFSGCFLLALYLSLPLDPLTRQIEQMASRQGLKLQVLTPRLSFPPGISADQLLLSSDQIPHPPFELSEVKVRPLWASLFGRNQGASFRFELFNGEVNGTAYRNGEVAVEASGLKLRESLAPQLPLQVSAAVDTATFDGILPLAGKNRSDLQLLLRDVLVEGMQKLGSGNDQLLLGELKCQAEAQGTLVRISSLTLTGPAIDLKGSGSLRVGRTAAASSLNLSLELRPKEGLDPMLNDLLKLAKKPQPDGSYRLNLRGSLSNPQLN